MVLAENEWTSMTFLRKSLMDKTFKVGGTGPREINPFTGMAMEGNISLEEAQRASKKAFIEKVLRSTNGNRSVAARKLDIQRTYLSRLIKELNIEI